MAFTTPNVIPLPAEQSMWRDDVLHITYTVIGIDRNEALVVCRHGNRTWNDAMHLSLFGTELRAI